MVPPLYAYQKDIKLPAYTICLQVLPFLNHAPDWWISKRAFISFWNAFDFKLILETKPKFEVNQTYPTCSFSEHAFCAAPVMRNFTNKGCDCFPGAGISLKLFDVSCHMTHVMEWSVNPCERLSIGPFHRWKYNLRILAIATSNSRFFKNWSIYRDRCWIVYDNRLVK